MEEELNCLGKSLGGFCSHLQSSCDAFNNSLQRRPIPLDSASSTFIKSLNRRLSTADSELNFLDSMSFGTVSFEELLGHSNQIYKNNQEDLLRLQDCLTDFGYVPEIEIDESKEEESDFGAFEHEGSKHSDDDLEPHSLQRSVFKGLDEDDLLDDSLNLKNLELSDACLATLALKGALPASKASMLSNEDEYATLDMDRTSVPAITLVKEEYESLPSYMKALASWKKERNGCYYFRADEISTLGLGHKEKAYTVLLTRMKRFLVETSDGLVSYRVA
ncbi:hypothetical protein EUTSA_v10014358mg [Eutrema salsugineum]|uniref:Uncharacterized protein n=1 Tax=Eutrema salsugineum TaxID=72664 RepID=V4KRF5_EUTSA|nr:hypothetical protein EUTSA_v10014358mg [Eutrema salsugineum]